MPDTMPQVRPFTPMTRDRGAFTKGTMPQVQPRGFTIRAVGESSGVTTPPDRQPSSMMVRHAVSTSATTPRGPRLP